IFRIHIARRGRNCALFDLESLTHLAQGFSGAEIEQAIISALYHAFGAGLELQQEHIVKAVQETFPLSATMAEEIARLRAWAGSRTRPASAAAAASTPLAARFG